MPIQLRGSSLKLQRAERHVIELNAEIGKFLIRKPYALVVEKDKNPGQQNYVLRVRENIPDDFPCFIGDCIHNLRSALDLAAVQLVKVQGDDGKGVYFPFTDDASKLDGAIAARKINKAAPGVEAYIRSLKPYPGGNDALRAIHDLDIMDKHQLIIPTADAIGIPHLRIGTNEFSNCSFGPLRDGMVPFSFPRAANVQFGQKFYPTLIITFGDGYFARKPAIETLYELVRLVTEIIDTLEAI
jgi:hypothetical protein